MLFLVLFEGRGFEATFDGERRRIGFHCNRRVESGSVEKLDPSEAIALILEQLKELGVDPRAEAAIEVDLVSEFEPRNAEDIHNFTFFPEESSFRRYINRVFAPRRKKSVE